MKSLVPFSAAVVLSLGLVTLAQAAPLSRFEAEVVEAGPGGVAGPAFDDPHHACHGAASGTAHPSCGSLTGGPSGGLF